MGIGLGFCCCGGCSCDSFPDEIDIEITVPINTTWPCTSAFYGTGATFTGTFLKSATVLDPSYWPQDASCRSSCTWGGTVAWAEGGPLEFTQCAVSVNPTTLKASFTIWWWVYPGVWSVCVYGCGDLTGCELPVTFDLHKVGASSPVGSITISEHPPEGRMLMSATPGASAQSEAVEPIDPELLKVCRGGCPEYERMDFADSGVSQERCWLGISRVSEDGTSACHNRALAQWLGRAFGKIPPCERQRAISPQS